MPAKNFGLVGFLIGLATGSVVSLLYAPQSGREFRSNLRKDFPGSLISKAKSIASDISERSEKFVETAKKIADGRYAGTVETIENELYSLKHAVNEAMNNYKKNSDFGKPTNQQVDDLFIDFEDEILPKFVGMGRRDR